MTRFKAFRVHEQGGRIAGALEDLTLDDLSRGEVVIRASWSSVNYKDALAGTGRGKIMSRFPLVGGIDVSGVVETSDDARFKVGDEVLVTGYGMSQDHDGGYAGFVRVPADWVVPLPGGLSLREVMLLGTAGFTAALAVERLQQLGQSPEMGPVAVTGATGGVGSIAVDLLARQGFHVTAITGKPDSGWLGEIGASEILPRSAIDMDGRPLEHARWGGAVDNVGGEMLAWLTRTVRLWGGIASIGLAGGHALNTTVMPFILRGVSLLGISSANCPMPLRRKVWKRLATDLKPRYLDKIENSEVTLEGLSGVFEAILDGRHRGRTVVRMS